MDPSYLLPRPQFDLTPGKQAAFEDLWQSTAAGHFIDYRLPYPKWEYLTYLCDTKELVLHGSPFTGIDIVEPRQAKDIRAFSNQQAIYATTDGIWVIYFAVVDRKKFPQMTLFNTCLRARLNGDQLTDPMYFFSITHSVLIQKPWCEGAVYILPRHTFIQEAPQHLQGAEIIFPHWISNFSAKPAARLMVGPSDFPFLAQIHGHDDEKLIDSYSINPGVFPLEALES